MESLNYYNILLEQGKTSRKAMEIPGAGPCLFTDTAGFDDDDGRLGKERRLLTAKALQQTDIAIMIFRDCGSEEKEWFRTVSARKIPVIPVINKADTATEEEAGMAGRLAEETERLCGTPPVLVCAKTGEGVQDIYSAILRAVPEEHGRHSITGGLAGPGDTVVLVMPQDILAPKGRLILPQAQTIRELLELGCTVISSRKYSGKYTRQSRPALPSPLSPYFSRPTKAISAYSCRVRKPSGIWTGDPAS